jgi:hypothetical protein
MPFDQAASFELKGIPGNIVQDVINISSDSVFVAVAIGYGFEENRAVPAPLSEPESVVPGDVRLEQIPVTALIEGFRLNPRFERLLFTDPPATAGRPGPARERTLSTVPIDQAYSANIVERLKSAEEISFLFSIVDSATGRELQDEPIHNLASLGSSNGDRPFRPLAQPLAFQPRSTIRLQIVERSEGIQGTLFIVLYGYKILGAAACAEPVVRMLSAPPAFGSQAAGPPSARVIPFDYVSKFQLTGTPRHQIEDEVPINVEGGFIATSIGYGLGVESLRVAVKPPPPAPSPPTTLPLGDLTLADFPTSALQDGIRIRPNFVRVAFSNGGALETNFPVNLLGEVFERLNRPEDVSFRYSIFDSGTGRELQNQPINNIAGLGIANGERPFKKLARPMLFLPRSTIRVNVEEVFGRGTLFIVFQGYKLLQPGAADPSAAQRRRTRRR